MDFQKFVEWTFYSLLGGMAVYVVHQISELTNSVVELNKNLAVILEKMLWHDKMLDKHDAEIENLKSERTK